MLKYARKRLRPINIAPIKGADVLYETMQRYRVEIKEYVLTLRHAFSNFKMDDRIKTAEIKSLTQQLYKMDEFVVDIAHKLAPYQSPKLESIEVKNQIEHKFVLRAPDKVASVEEWMKKTGADKLQSDQINPKVKEHAEPTESLYDFEEDEEKTFKQLH